MCDGWFAPTASLNEVDPNCADLDYLMGEARTLETDCMMSNNFAFGANNTSLIFMKR